MSLVTPDASTGLFARWMDELEALQPLRYADPQRVLATLTEMRTRWPAGLPPAQDALLQARFALHAGAVLAITGRHDESRRELAQADDRLASPALNPPPPELAENAERCAVAVANASAVLAHALGDLGGALRAYLHALQHAQALGDRRYQAYVHVNLANTYEACGLHAEALEALHAALPMAQAQGMDELIGDIHHNIGNALGVGGDPEAGLASNRRALQAYEALGLGQKARYALVAIAERLLEQGCLDEAAAALEERARRPQDFDSPSYDAYAHYLAGQIAARQGRVEAARQAFEASLSLNREPLHDRLGQGRALRELARLLRAQGDVAAAEAHAAEALALLAGGEARRDEMACHELRAALAKQRGDLARALAHQEALHALYVAVFNDESARQARALAVRHEVDMARAEARRQRLENARLTEALAAIARRLEPDPAAPAARGPTRPEDLQSLGLTPREAEVLFWVTQGKTNEDVTRIMSISLSAVKKHLLRVYEKLGVENRTAAANAARRRQ